MKVSMISAKGLNNVIGTKNDLPWHLPDDFLYFKETTKNHHVIMGRKNYESIPHRFRPLPQRTNIVVSRNANYEIPKGVYLVDGVEKALSIARSNQEDEAFIIGGGEIYRVGLEIATKLYLTEINAVFDGEVYFPEFDLSIWKETSRTSHPADDRHKYKFDFVVYEKNE